MNTRTRLFFSFVAIPLILTSSHAIASEAGREGIGFYTAVSGRVTVEHSGETQMFPVKLHDQVLFKDMIETQRQSRTRAFFEDDSMLTVGENSRVEINEYVYQPEHNLRRAIVKLMQGRVRALVSKVFKANGSRFEVHTPSAVAAARGTYFAVWVENGQSGIINIGEKGRVDFTSGGKTVAVDPGFFSIAQAGSAPSDPMPHHIGADNDKPVKSVEKSASTVVLTHDRNAATVLPQREKLELMQTASSVGLIQALAAVEDTILRDAPLIELPAQTLRALNVDARLMQALATLTDLTTESLASNNGGTATVTTGTLTTGALTVGSVSVGTASTSGGGSLPVGSVSIGSTTVAPLAPVTSAVGVVAPVVSSVVAPLAPLVSTVVAPIAPVISTVVAPVAPVIAPVVAPLAPVINPLLATPPAVINGALLRH